MKQLLTLFFLLLSLSALAQPGIAEMQQAKQDLSSIFFSAFDFSMVAAALLGITGAVKIYHKMQMGDREFTADVAAWFFAALFMVLSGVFLRALFWI